MTRLPSKMKLRRQVLSVLSALALTGIASAPALAQSTFPDKPIQIVCAFPPGNASDIVARIIGEHLSKRIGQPVFVENKPGASGIIAAQAVQRAKPDGYTLLMTSTSFIINKSVIKSVPYTLENDFTAVSLINSIPVVFLVRNNFPAQNMQEWAAEIKRNPDKYNYAHPGKGTIHNLSTKLLLQKTGTDVTEIPYKGSMQALTDLMGGTIDMMFEAANSAYTNVKSGKMRALATSGPTRYYALPDVPTMQEAGVDVNTVGFTALMAPAQTPTKIVDFLNTEIQSVLQLPDVQTALRNTALELHPPMSSSEAQAWLVKESDNWANVATAANLIKE